MVKNFKASEQSAQSQEMIHVFNIIHSAIQKCPKYNELSNYTLETKKSYILNTILQSQIASLNQELSSIKNSLSNSISSQSESKKLRRKSNQIEKKYKCASCNKTYGSEASMNLHIKLKHSIVNESETSSTKHNDKDHILNEGSASLHPIDFN